MFQVVALMGAHTFGTASQQFSGHIGPWIQRKGNGPTFDNKYYQNMIDTSLDYNGVVSHTILQMKFKIY